MICSKCSQAQLARLLLVFFFARAHPAFSASTALFPAADTTLSENYPNNNFGGMQFVNSGTTQNITRNRGLFRFDISGNIPTGSKIKSASLVLSVTHLPADDYSFSGFDLHRLLQPWGEGNKVTPPGNLNVGMGAAATTNEATWIYRFAFTSNTWSIPGGAASIDFSPAVSSFQYIYALSDSPYTVPSTAQMVADVQAWLNNPLTNYGWMLICEAEGSGFTARRFGSREDPSNAPELDIEYITAPKIDYLQRTAAQINLFFTAVPGQSYVVEFRDSLNSGAWQPLANVGSFPEETRVLIVDGSSLPRRFYRLSSY